MNLRAYEERLTASTQQSQDLERQLKQEEDDKAQLLGTVENLQEQLSTAEMQAKSIADESDATITSLRSELTEVHRNCANLRRQLGDAEEHRDRIIQVQSLTEERLAREHVEVGQLRGELGTTTSEVATPVADESGSTRSCRLTVTPEEEIDRSKITSWRFSFGKTLHSSSQNSRKQKACTSQIPLGFRVNWIRHLKNCSAQWRQSRKHQRQCCRLQAHMKQLSKKMHQSNVP